MSLLINADFSQRVVIATHDQPWIASPQAGVERRMLDRIGGEVARATSLVRYAAASVFPPHIHELGEEFLVLEGVFRDDYGDYPVGTYVRNPPGSRHAPRSEPGCVILVKLRQMPVTETERLVVDTSAALWESGEGAGHSRLPLFAGEGERVELERLDAGARLTENSCEGGEEVFVISGELADEDGVYPAGTWIRNPPGHKRGFRSPRGCVYWVKQGHLRK